MNERRGRSEEPRKLESLDLKVGYNAVFVPVMERKKPDYDPILDGVDRSRIPLTEKEAQKELQSLLDSIRAEGGEIVGQIQVDVLPNGTQYNGYRQEPKPSRRDVFIVEKKE